MTYHYSFKEAFSFSFHRFQGNLSKMSSTYLYVFMAVQLTANLNAFPVEEMGKRDDQCPPGNPKLYELPFTTLLVDGPTAQRKYVSSAKPCTFVDLNNDHFVDYACSFCFSYFDEGYECFSLPNSATSGRTVTRCTYINTRCGWILAEKYNATIDYCK